MKKNLPNVTLIAVCGNKQAETITSMYKSLIAITPAKVVMLTNIDITADGIEVINVGGLDSWGAYNQFIIKELYKYFDTSHCLIVQYDSWVLNGDLWNDDYLNYDIIGARGLSDGRNNYNGGFSLRSLAFQTAIAQDDFIDIYSPEDEVLCRLYRAYLEKKYGMIYCTDEIADSFAYELHEPTQLTFGFHNFHRQPFEETIVVRRTGAMGDVIMCENILHYFYQKGCRVVLDTQPEFYRLYSQHYFPVLHISQLNQKVKYREIDLNMAYEIKPKQSVLQSYFQMSGIKDGIFRNARLSLASGDNQKMFNKYVVVHINYTDMPYRNTYGIKWKPVAEYLKKQGYIVFQIGKNVKEDIGIPTNTMSIEFMMFFIKGASCFIGSDSGPAQIAVGFGIPSVIFFGSVNAKLRYSNFENIRVVQSACPKKETEHCYHSTVDVVGVDCVHNKQLPPCTQYTSEQVINAIKELI